MNSYQICIVQQVWDQSDTSGNKRGEDVFAVFDDTRFLRWRFCNWFQNGDPSGLSNDYRSAADLTLCEIHKGVDWHASAIAAGGAGMIDLAHWQVVSTSGNRYVRTTGVSVTAPLTFTVPAFCDRVYIQGTAIAGNGTAQVTITAGTLVKASLNFAPNQDFGTGGLYTRASRSCLVAQDCAGATITITPDGNGRVYVQGVLMVGAALAEPDDVVAVAGWDGVVDPATEVAVQLGADTDIQAAFAPIFLFDSSNNSGWCGCGHWDANVTLTGPVETRVYRAGGTSSVWAPAINARVVQLADVLDYELSGTISFFTNAVGSYWHRMRLTPSGLVIQWRMTWNAQAVAIGLAVDASSSGGGYCAQWGLNQSFDRVRNPSYSNDWTEISTWDDANYLDGYNGSELHATNNNVIASLKWDAPFDSSSFVDARPDMGGFPKFYARMLAGSTDHAFTDGEITGATLWRTVLLGSEFAVSPSPSPSPSASPSPSPSPNPVALGPAIHAVLAASQAIIGVVDNKIYRERAPLGVAIPFITFEVLKNPPEYHQGGPSNLYSAKVVVDCWCTTRSQADGLMDDVFTAVQGLTGVVGVFQEGSGIEAIEGENSGDSPIFNGTHEYLVWARS